MTRAPADLLEIATAEHLRLLGRGEVAFEPDGPSSFPDFRVGTSLIVEVTRLEKAILTANGESEHHSPHHVPFLHAIENAIEKACPPKGANDWAVCLSVRHPQDRRMVARGLAKLIDLVGKCPDYWANQRISLAEGVEARFARGEEASQPRFYLGSVDPNDLNGWIVPDTIDQINEAIERKTPKLREYSGCFDEAWLAVGGGSSTGLAHRDEHLVQSELIKGSGWRKILLLRVHQPEKCCLFDV